MAEATTEVLVLEGTVSVTGHSGGERVVAAGQSVVGDGKSLSEVVEIGVEGIHSRYPRVAEARADLEATDPPDDTGGGDSVIPIVIGSIAGLLLVATVIVIGVFRRRRRTRPAPPPPPPSPGIAEPPPPTPSA